MSVRFDDLGPPIRRSAIPKDRDETWIAGWYSLTLTLTLTLTLGIRPIDLRPPMALLRNGGQDLRSGGPLPTVGGRIASSMGDSFLFVLANTYECSGTSQ